MTRLPTAAPIDLLAQLADTGTRVATSVNEARAAALAGSWLRRVGLRVSTDTFQAPTSPGMTYMLLAVLGLLTVVLAWWQPLAALLPALAGLLLAVSDGLIARIPALTTYRDTQNIVAVRASATADQPPLTPPRWRVVLLAPLDTPPSQHWLRRYVGQQPFAQTTRIAAFLLLVLLVLLQPLLTSDMASDMLLIAQLVPVGWLWLSVATLPPQPVPARHTAQSGALAAMLATTERIADLQDVELWAVALGATTTTTHAIEDLLTRYPFEPDSTLFIHIAGIHQPPLTVAQHEGLRGQYRADPLLHDHLHTTARQLGVTLHDGTWRQAHTSSSYLLAHGYRVATVLSHIPPAVTTAITNDTLEATVTLLAGVVQRLDQMPATPAPTASPGV